MDPKHWPSPAAPRLLIPGYPQWSWRQRERALVLFASYSSAMVVGVDAWGSVVGFLILTFAFATHTYSAADAIRQQAFPGFGRVVPTVTASAGLGAFCYGPALALASVFAWPVIPEERPREGYLVNRWAYARDDPRPGETVWLRGSRGVRPKLARVVAGPGQKVEWSGRELRVDDRPVEGSPFLAAGLPGLLRMEVPPDFVLVTLGPDAPGSRSLPGGWEIVGRSEVRGRAWARSHPFWSRRLLR